jgi:hypothetical protein
VGTAVISGGNPPPILEASEHALDAISLSVGLLVVFDRFLATGTTGNAGFDPETDQSAPELGTGTHTRILRLI